MPDNPADQSGKDHHRVIERRNPAGRSALVGEDDQHLAQRHHHSDAAEEKPFLQVGVFPLPDGKWSRGTEEKRK
jgi:hypothetical protein